MTFFFTSLLLPPQNRETGGRILSISVPVVRKVPSRKEFSIKVLVSSGLSFYSAVIVESSSEIAIAN